MIQTHRLWDYNLLTKEKILTEELSQSRYIGPDGEFNKIFNEIAVSERPNQVAGVQCSSGTVGNWKDFCLVNGRLSPPIMMFEPHIYTV
jgi:hypothetical protein